MIIRILFEGGAFLKTDESVVMLRLKILKSSATLLNISVSFGDVRFAGLALMALSQFQAVPFTTSPSKSRYTVADAAELLLNFGIACEKQTCVSNNTETVM
jgi:hypothetical protein